MNREDLDDEIFAAIVELQEALGEWLGIEETYIPLYLQPVARAYAKLCEIHTSIEVAQGGAQ